MSGKLQPFLAGFRSQFEPALTKYLNAKVASLGTLDPIGQFVASVLRDFALSGGKRIRPALVVIGYQAMGGEGNDILKAAIAAELFHAFFLVHDDIIDKSSSRRNRPTVHRVFEEDCRRFKKLSDPEVSQLGQSLALLGGDLLCAVAYEALTQSDFPPERIVSALRRMHAMAESTLVGQVLDVLLPLQTEVREAEVARVHLLKTARYSFESPLHLGMILAGARGDALEQMSRYALPVGIAFQVQDDLLGMFGSEKEVGKPVTSDLAEGKQTLLTVFARKRVGRAESTQLNALIGKRDLTPAEIEEARSIFRRTGAVSHSEACAERLVRQATRALRNLAIPESSKELLRELAGYAINRTT